MEIHQRPDSLDRSLDKSRETQSVGGRPTSDITRQNRESIRRVTEPLRLDRADRIELSATAESLTKDEDTLAAEKMERLEALRGSMQAGMLNDAQRIERAAHQLLSGE